jgi:alpha-amylase
MKSLHLIFQIHQPYRLRQYRFFEIGHDHYYYDDYANETLMLWLANKCYIPALSMLYRKIVQHKGALKVSFYISGVALDLVSRYTPSVTELLKKLAGTGHVEFIGGTWSHTLASLKSQQTFKDEIKHHQQAIQESFAQIPTTFLNSELIYSDDIGVLINQEGYHSVITEGAKHILGWRSPGMIYTNPSCPDLKIFMRHFSLSDDLTFRFSSPQWKNYPLTPAKFLSWVEESNPGDQVVNVCIDFEVLGAMHSAESGIFSFMESFLTQVVKSDKLKFGLPSESGKLYPPASIVSVPHPLSWAQEERDISIWSGNELQQEALNKLYNIASEIRKCHDSELNRDWQLLQTSDHFYYMSTRYYNAELKHRPNPYLTPHDAFVNYMNILSDLKLRLQLITPIHVFSDETVKLKRENIELRNQIRNLRNEVKTLKRHKNRKS